MPEFASTFPTSEIKLESRSGSFRHRMFPALSRAMGMTETVERREQWLRRIFAEAPERALN